jgi:hypothetical protein
MFQRNGIAAASIDGTMDSCARRELLQDLGTGKLKGADQLRPHR